MNLRLSFLAVLGMVSSVQAGELHHFPLKQTLKDISPCFNNGGYYSIQLSYETTKLDVDVRFDFLGTTITTANIIDDRPTEGIETNTSWTFTTRKGCQDFRDQLIAKTHP